MQRKAGPLRVAAGAELWGPEQQLGAEGGLEGGLGRGGGPGAQPGWGQGSA